MLQQFEGRLRHSGTIEQPEQHIQSDPTDIGRVGFLHVAPLNLREAVFHLLTNALKYAEEEGEPIVRVAVEETAGSYIIKFQDWGMGVQDESEQMIFEEGYRAPEAIKMYPMGSGMGLTIARDLMRQMGADLRLTHKSKPTEFQMILPKTLREQPNR